METLKPVAGLVIFILLAILLSEDKKNINYKVILIGVISQICLGFVFLKVKFFTSVFLLMSKVVSIIQMATKDGASYMFGYLSGGTLPFTEISKGSSFIIAFQILPIIIVVSALSAILYYLKIIPWLIHFLGKVIHRIFNLSGVGTLSVASSIFFGIIEGPLFVRNYLAKSSRSELFLIISASMSTVAGTVMVLYSSVLDGILENPIQHIITASLMSAPAAIMYSTIIIPEKKRPRQKKYIFKHEKKYDSLTDALIKGTEEGLSMVFSVIALIIVLFSFISIINQAFSYLPLENNITIERIISYIYLPFCYLLGIDQQNLELASKLMATKTALNEFVAYLNFKEMGNAFSLKDRAIMTYSLCGFANFASFGILVGALSKIMPLRKKEITSLSLKGLVVGNLATMTTGLIIGLIF